MGEWVGETVGPDVWETCRDLIPAGSVFAFLAEHRGRLFPAEMFADMYPSANGRPSMPPQILAAAITLQALHGLSDFETVQELRCDLRWKAACGLGLHDMAFDPSLLAYFRRRLARSVRPNRIFETVREVVRATGVLKGKHRRALDSTVLDDAVATQDTVTQIIAAIRAVIREVPRAAGVAAVQCTAHDYADPGKPRIAWNDEQARAAPRRRAGHRRGAAAGTPARAAARGEGRERRRPAGPGRRTGRRTRRGLRRPRRSLAHHPGHRLRPDDLHRRSRSPSCPQDPHTPPGRLQGPPGHRARDRVIHRRRPAARHRRRTSRGHRRRRPARRRDHPGGRLRRHRLLHRRHLPESAAGRTPALPQTRPAQDRGPRRVQPRRLRHRHRGQHGDLPRRPHRPALPAVRAAQATQSGLHRPVHRLPPTRAVHHRQGRPDHHHPTAP